MMRAKTLIGATLIGAAAGGAGLWASWPAGPTASVTESAPILGTQPSVASGPPAGAPETELASWFQQQVVQHLEPQADVRPASGRAETHGSRRDEVPRLASARSLPLGAPRPDATRGRTERSEVPARTRREQALREELADDPNVDWDYLEAVYAGRVSGIPNESKAGIPLQEIDALGEVPYFEELREAGDLAALDSLDLPHSRNFPVCKVIGGQRFPVCEIL